jgi:hypothetical protein
MARPDRPRRAKSSGLWFFQIGPAVAEIRADEFVGTALCVCAFLSRWIFAHTFMRAHKFFSFLGITRVRGVVGSRNLRPNFLFVAVHVSC